MSADPEAFAAAARDFTGIGSSITSANSAAAAPTTLVAAAAQDEVSAAIAALFGSYAQGYQTLAARAAAFHDEFTRNLLSGANSYSATEAANVSPLLYADYERTRLLEQQYLEALARGDTQTAFELSYKLQIAKNDLTNLEMRLEPPTNSGPSFLLRTRT